MRYGISLRNIRERTLMADSADDLLARARQAMTGDLEYDDAFIELKDAVSDLDTLLSAGGPLPAAWADCAPVINVVSHIPDIVDLPDGDQVFAPTPRTGLIREVIDTRRVNELLTSDLNAEVGRHNGTRNRLAVARNEIADREAQISRLTAELDATRNVPVEYVITSGLEAAMAADPHREDGSVLRTTDGKREAWAWKAATSAWDQVT